jgi:hypothetical protein
VELALFYGTLSGIRGDQINRCVLIVQPKSVTQKFRENGDVVRRFIKDDHKATNSPEGHTPTSMCGGLARVRGDLPLRVGKYVGRQGQVWRLEEGVLSSSR